MKRLLVLVALAALALLVFNGVRSTFPALQLTPPENIIWAERFPRPGGSDHLSFWARSGEQWRLEDAGSGKVVIWDGGSFVRDAGLGVHAEKLDSYPIIEALYRDLRWRIPVIRTKNIYAWDVPAPDGEGRARLFTDASTGFPIEIAYTEVDGTPNVSRYVLLRAVRPGDERFFRPDSPSRLLASEFGRFVEYELRRREPELVVLRTQLASIQAMRNRRLNHGD